jgi:hypothetical protein
LSALKNLENASLTPNQLKNRIFEIFMVFWADLALGKRFKFFKCAQSIPCIEEAPLQIFFAKIWSKNRKNPFFSHPVNA